MRWPWDDVMHDAVKGIKKNRKFRKNQDHKFIWLQNYKNAIEGNYKYPPCFICSTAKHEKERERREKRRRKEREKGRKKERKFWRSWKQNRDSRVLLSF